MTKPRKTPKPKTLPESDIFFEKELPGEHALTLETAGRLYDLASLLYSYRPWLMLGDSELIVVEPPGLTDWCYCSIMGALGQVYQMYAHIGEDGYRLVRKLASGRKVNPGEFLASLHGVSVEFVPPVELTPPDRKLLRAFGHPFKAEFVCPIFRANRPGYHAWYVTEEEGQILATCLIAVNAFCASLVDGRRVDYWKNRDEFPLVTLTGGSGEAGYEITQVKPDHSPAPKPGPVAIEPLRVARIRDSGYNVARIMEIGLVYGTAPIGRKNERKAATRLAIAADAESMFAYKPVVAAPDVTNESLLAQVIQTAIEESRMIPATVRVTDPDFVLSLQPLADILGFKFEVARKLPAIDSFKKALLKWMTKEGRHLL